MASWDPATYLRFADERSRPFFDLVARVGAEDPATVVDLGCGPGQLTASLADRWPMAQVIGVDSSPEMVARAHEQNPGRVRYVQADLRDWRSTEPIDLIVSNATLQWVPDHRRLLPRLVDMLAAGGWLAFQVPGNFGEPSHQLLRELAADDRFAAATRDVEFPAAAEPVDYLTDLTGLGCRVDAWETTYLHLLSGEDPVFSWVSGTGARPILQALSGDQREVFVDEYKERLRAAYPAAPYGTVLPFRRIFAVAQLAGGRSQPGR
jgi:trans-aconitate 2-methyltransferase